ncbi:MAG: SpoIIE family protein phosphatase [Sphingobacteriaceae bacterium]|nr:SpoIIE family protein phosphatase [Sphingobacteriaceae bacterium]
MAYRFTIGRRIGFGFAIFILLTMVAFISTVLTIRESKSRTRTVVEQVTPSVIELRQLNFLLQKSYTNISKWFYNKSFNDLEFRDELIKIIDKDYYKQKHRLQELSVSWTPQEKDQLRQIFSRVEKLFKVYKSEITDQLTSTEAYEDPNILMMARMSYEDSELNIKALFKTLNELIISKQNNAVSVTNSMFKGFNFLNTFVEILGIALVVGGILIAVFTTRSITRPVHKLKKVLLSMGLGILPTERITTGEDEIGEMGKALNELVQSMRQTTDFAKETGSGNFDATYTPLSKDDTLGYALIKMRDDLAVNERELERKVIERTEEVVRQKEEIEGKNAELEILYKQVTDSIHYAKRIQEAILPPNKVLEQNLPNSFVLYHPKDIVSGDFYWIERKEKLVYFAAVDCTGHGVPGAFMSLVGHNILKDIINNSNLKKPAEIMDRLREGVINTLHADKSGGETKDGMDMTLCCLNYDTLELQFAAAFNPLYIIRNKNLIEHKANKFPIGAFIGEKQNFTNNTIQLQKGDQIFIFSDGYADQFGGPKGKKFMVGNFRKLLTEIALLDAKNQKEVLETTMAEWRGDQEQVDDVLVIGVKV